MGGIPGCETVWVNGNELLYFSCLKTRISEFMACKVVGRGEEAVKEEELQSEKLSEFRLTLFIFLLSGILHTTFALLINTRCGIY